MKYLLLFFALFFGLSAEAQTLRFEADTVFLTRSGVRFDHASVALQPFEDGSLGVVLSPIKELNDWERARIQQYLNSKSAFRGRPMRWTDVPVDAVPVVWESPAASSSPVNSLESAGRSFLAVPLIGVGTGLAGWVSAAAKTLLDAETTRFNAGESSVFLLIARETAWLEAERAAADAEADAMLAARRLDFRTYRWE